MDTGDWRTQLPSGSRQKIVNKISQTLMKHLAFSGPQGSTEVKRIASNFEERIFNNAVSQSDYLRQISLKMMVMETKAQKPPASSPSILAVNNILPLDQGHHIDNDNSNNSLPKEEPAENTGDWRTQLLPDSRQKNVNKIVETLKNHVLNSGQEGIDEFMRIGVSFEDLIFNTAINQVDYFRKISFKMLTVEDVEA